MAPSHRVNRTTGNNSATVADTPITTRADTITILVATDNHVGFKEEDTIRGDDSWRSFHEVMEIAKARDVDMVLLGGDLFDHHTPSRKSLLKVAEALRANCLGDKPCELEFLGDGSEIFGGQFNNVNYEDPNINIAIPVFSIHGNHDEPTGHEFYCALDVLHTTGLINYFGRVYENDNIHVKPVLLRKGKTKLALYGISNVRDERLFRSFRDNKVKFYQPQPPSQSTNRSIASPDNDDWFNLMAVHQNHHARTPTGYLPESFLPDFLDLVIWGHEHDCLIEPVQSSDAAFHVSQPGSSIVTQLTRGEMGPKKIGLLTVTGKEFHMEPIQLKTPRPFLMRDIVLQDEPALKNVWKKSDNRDIVTKFIKRTIEDMIEEAKEEWIEQQQLDTAHIEPDPEKFPKPLLRLRIDYTAPEGGLFDVENSRRIGNEYNQRIANHEEVILFHQKKRSTALKKAANVDQVNVESMSLDSVKVDSLVREFLTAQSLKVLPHNSFGDSVDQFVTRDDKHAMEIFVNEALSSQVKNLLALQDFEQTDLTDVMDAYRQEREQLFSTTGRRSWNKGTRKLKPRPSHWDSDVDGAWEDQPGAIIVDENGDDGDDPDAMDVDPVRPRARGAVASRARGAATKGATTATTPAASRRNAAAKSKAAVAPSGKATASRSRRNMPFVDDDEEDEEEEEEEEQQDNSQSQPLFVPHTRGKAAAPGKSTTSRSAAGKSGRQSTLDFSQPAARPSRAAASRKNPVIIDSDEEDEIEDSDDDAFENPPPAPVATGRRRNR